ncbi:HD domain-containing protein [Deinococcus maricopensis]|uniref:Metal dependent phosphohydrolase n=1 Tax=Deinococcus maricopensis (strain DSM 21211 / LMG 22137 / NRRL B-23946 / LB-34) TaxID=709986 RepID=E8U7R5_DEIML|nr:HD domain-containing protein [Deinococcus maricopensis]ADV67104.1 metal dependent phosphohydrolase [Deinococcus maricopensis DSM 21211]
MIGRTLWRKARGLRGKLRRLARSVSARQAHPDDAWAERHLTPPETRVYARMDARDREHALRVTRRMLRDHPDASADLVAAALLHDCGKSIRPYRVLERVLLAAIPNRAARLLPAWTFGPFAALTVRAHHPTLGADLLRTAGGRARVAQLVARHHTPGADAEAALLHLYDDLE